MNDGVDSPDAPHPGGLSAAAMRDALIAALDWQVECGVDETIGEAPVDRTAQPDRAVQSERAASNLKSAIRTEPGPKRGKAAPAAEPDRDAPPDLEALTRDARRAAAGAADLAALREALAGFEGSSLKAGAKNCVFADGDPRAAVMAIGEGPGKDEDRIGKPFVGRSGQLLDRMLAAIGLDRASADPASGVYIVNLVPWRPLGNRTPDDQEVSVLAPFLERHVALARPKVILCLGGAPAKHVMGARTGVTKFRGSWNEYARDDLSIPCLSTLHPAYLLRSPEMKRFAWRDLLALRARLDALLDE